MHIDNWTYTMTSKVYTIMLWLTIYYPTFNPTCDSNKFSVSKLDIPVINHAVYSEK